MRTSFAGIVLGRQQGSTNCGSWAHGLYMLVLISAKCAACNPYIPASVSLESTSCMFTDLALSRVCVVCRLLLCRARAASRHVHVLIWSPERQMADTLAVGVVCGVLSQGSCCLAACPGLEEHYRKHHARGAALHNGAAAANKVLTVAVMRDQQDFSSTVRVGQLTSDAGWVVCYSSLLRQECSTSRRGCCSQHVVQSNYRGGDGGQQDQYCTDGATVK